MIVQPIHSFANYVNDKFDQSCRKISHFLDRHPVLYKVMLVASHLFRAAGMYGLMMISPLPLAVNCAGMLAGSVLYRASVERFCCFHFALPSCAGAAAIWILRVPAIQLISGAAFSSPGMAAASVVGALPLLGYVGYIIYLSHTEYEGKMNRAFVNSSCTGCV
jgi:hypothetical protein